MAEAAVTERDRALAVVRERLHALFDLDGTIDLDTEFGDLGLDSLEVVEALLSLQERLVDEMGDDEDLSLPTGGVTLVRVGDLVDILVDLGWLRSPRMAAILESSR
jgi:acyl carrier protein